MCGLQRHAKSVRVDLLEVAARRAHPSPPAGNGRQGFRRKRAKVLLLRVVEHEVEVAPVPRQGGEDAARRTEGEAVEVRCLAGIVELKRELPRAFGRNGHESRLPPAQRNRARPSTGAGPGASAVRF